MSLRRVNPCRLKKHRSYTVSEVAELLGVHKNTVRGWIARGLETVDDRRPILIRGVVLRAFLEKQREQRRQPCRAGTMFCFRCREPRRPASDMVDYSPITRSSGNLCAMCEHCETLMYRRARLSDVPYVMPGLSVRIAEAPAPLNGRMAPS